MKAANRLQELTMQFATVGRTGNQALRDARMQAVKEGLVPAIYCHAVGYHGHAAGPPIGMTDYQEGVPVRGDYQFRPNTWHSIELNATHKVPEWGGQEVRAWPSKKTRRSCPTGAGTGCSDGRSSSI